MCCVESKMQDLFDQRLTLPSFHSLGAREFNIQKLRRKISEQMMHVVIGGVSSRTRSGAISCICLPSTFRTTYSRDMYVRRATCLRLPNPALIKVLIGGRSVGMIHFLARRIWRSDHYTDNFWINTSAGINGMQYFQHTLGCWSPVRLYLSNDIKDVVPKPS